ncbi:hypothetical protein [Rubripirellula reticaptiva]|uniref:Uncharacterized protein n=1 Tax=Rubripirellula reticaptiva TaxID=2528013 RepID=A0A5C6F7C8_9BACT|nr:hypothetical protein [Rubripirellula reticaptiva]TWU57613.1 hypothetical protein Poly59_05200 [Rubripirellula reticaptiva]
MQKIQLAMPLAAAALFTIGAVGLTGCRQTTGPVTAGSFGPVGPLSPVAPGQTPTLGPFGGNTRVTPPPTGSFTPQPNANIFAPTTQPQASFSDSAPNNAFGQAPIGSGVQTASWTETNATVPNPNQASATSPRTIDPRSGGMGVIDLTGAPNPPGYQPYTQFPPATVYPGYQQSSANQFQSITPASPNYSPQNSYAPQNYGAQAQPTLRPLTPPPSANPIDPGQIAASQTAETQWSTSQSSAQVNYPSGVATTLPSTAPIQTAQQSSDLQWRRPGTQY